MVSNSDLKKWLQTHEPSTFENFSKMSESERRMRIMELQERGKCNDARCVCNTAKLDKPPTLVSTVPVCTCMYVPVCLITTTQGWSGVGSHR